MMKVLVALARRSVPGLVRAAAVLALSGLALMSLSIVWPRPIIVVLAMSVGHVIGAAAVGCYVLGILLTMRRTPPPVAPEAASLPPATDDAAPSSPDASPAAPMG